MARNTEKRQSASPLQTLRSSLLCCYSASLILALVGCGKKQHSITNDYTSWSSYAGSADAAQYSSLDQINHSNVTRLEQAWSYPTGDNNPYFFAPLVVDAIAYVLAKNNSIVAIDATNGKEIWTHKLETGTSKLTNRGINYWESKDRSDRRLFFASDHHLRALNAQTGKSINTF